MYSVFIDYILYAIELIKLNDASIITVDFYLTIVNFPERKPCLVKTSLYIWTLGTPKKNLFSLLIG